MKMTYSMRQQHALIKMNAIFKFACHKDVAQSKSLYISCGYLWSHWYFRIFLHEK